MNINKNKIISISFIFSIAVLFIGYQLFKTKTYKVLKIKSAQSIVVDLNKNGVEDENETITILDKNSKVLSFSDMNFATKESKLLNTDVDTLLGVGYLADTFAKDNLLNKDIRLKKDKNDIYHVFYDNLDYNDKLSNLGFIIINGKSSNVYAFNKLIKKSEKSKFRIYNLKSHKFHRLSCKYGRLAHNSVIIPQSQLPEDSINCKYCLGKFKKYKHHKYKNKKNRVVCPSLVFKSNCIKIFLADFTTKLKPDRACNTSLCRELLHQINNSKDTIDIAIYGYDRVPAIDNAIKTAIARGVKVRLVYDIDSKGNNIYSDTAFLVNIINLSKSDVAPIDISARAKYTNSLMHDKFYIFDSKTVIAGSANLSHTDMSGYNHNSTMLIKSKEVANIYETEFDQMYEGKFHNLKDKISNKNNLSVGSSLLSVYFSPKDNIIKSAVLPLINSAHKYIYIPTFLITDKSVTQALISAKRRGVVVKVIVDATNAKGGHSMHQTLRNAGVRVKTENYAGKMHSKAIIVDDKFVAIGSMNLSKSGNYKNDENLIVLNNPKAAIFYRKFFDYLWIRIYNFWEKHDVSAESKYSFGSCNDGIDNDYDGKTDTADEECQKLRK